MLNEFGMIASAAGDMDAVPIAVNAIGTRAMSALARRIAMPSGAAHVMVNPPATKNPAGPRIASAAQPTPTRAAGLITGAMARRTGATGRMIAGLNRVTGKTGGGGNRTIIVAMMTPASATLRLCWG